MAKENPGINNGAIHDDKENVSTNPTDNRTFADVVSTRLSRRNIMRGSLAGAAASFLAPAPFIHAGGYKRGYSASSGPLVGFTPVSIADATFDQTLPTISEDYEYQIIIPWGTPIEPGATEPYLGDPDSRPTPQQASRQIGIGHDGMFFFPEDSRDRQRWGRRYRPSNTKGMLCINHEFGTNPHVLGKEAPENLQDVRLSQAVHGVSVVALERDYYEGWQVVSSPNSRRITVNTPMEFSGPAADSPLLQNPAGNVPLGTVNNCGAFTSLWGTYITCEENFNGYFGATEGETFNDNRTEEQQRYGFDYDGFGYGWELFDKRFDLSNPDYVNESNRFGWCVEIDPFDGTRKPVKRTALGRFKHEAIAMLETITGRVAVYMGDDQRGDYAYKFVSARPWRSAIAAGESPLDEGTLYVARFNDDGTGDWLPLDIAVNEELAARFETQADLLINVRLAADIAGATKMDRPEWTTIGLTSSVFWTLTNNNRKADGQGEVNAANPEEENNDGHIIRSKDAGRGDGATFTWEIYVLASTTRDTAGVFTDPDAAHADPWGRLFIGTDGGQPDGLQDQLVVFDTTLDTPAPQRLLVGVPSDEITGFAYTPDRCTAFVNVQHPGNGSPDDTNFPDSFNGVTIPRDATLVITRKDGGVIGS